MSRLANVSVLQVHGQQGYGTNGQGPQSAEELMASVHSVDDFIGLLVKRDGRPVAESESKFAGSLPAPSA